MQQRAERRFLKSIGGTDQLWEVQLCRAGSLEPVVSALRHSVPGFLNLRCAGVLDTDGRRVNCGSCRLTE